jgi:acyl-CoA thioesterase I
VLVVFVVAAIFLTVFAWAWAVRRPVVAGEVTTATPVPAERPPLVYAAIGASDVVGVGADDPSSESWVNQVYSRMPAGTRFLRLGRSGITLAEANDLEIPQVVAARPDIVTMWNCVNDVRRVQLADYIKELKSALNRLTKETNAHVVVLNVPDLSILLPANAPERTLVRGGVHQWNLAIAATAAHYGDRVTVVDLFPASDEVLDHPEYISPDNFHPSSAGYRRLAELVWQTIEDKGLAK